MTRRRTVPGRDPGNLVFGTIGWLFADLMFALAMVFLVATTVGQPAPPRSRPSPTPSPSPQRGLESQPVTITTKVDGQGLLSGKSSARADLQRKVRAKESLNGRQAGLVLSFGGGLDQGTEIAKKADAALKDLGDQGFVFQGAVYRPYISFGSSTNTLTLNIYLFKE